MEVALLETSKDLIVENLAIRTPIQLLDQRKANKAEGEI
jgi:hypothetical protein